MGRSGQASRVPAMMRSRSDRMSGSPPVKRTSCTPSSRCASATNRITSSAVIRAASGIGGSPSSGMQYVQRSEHFSVNETRRSRATRPKESTSSGVAGRVCGPAPGARRVSGTVTAATSPLRCRWPRV